MSDEVTATDQNILAEVQRILANQERILENQGAILANQEKLEQILANQRADRRQARG